MSQARVSATSPGLVGRRGRLLRERRCFSTWRSAVDLGAESGDAVGEDAGALGGFAFPEGDAGRSAVGVLDEDLALGVDALDAPAGVAEEDDVAGEESTAKCSSRVAIWTFSGWSMTAKMLVSGIAPPLEMAMLRAPRRAWRWPGRGRGGGKLRSGRGSSRCRCGGGRTTRRTARG